jgi:hypothetical protein
MSSVKDVQALIQDLQVHQIELEMQHEEPQKGRLHDIETMVDFFLEFSMVAIIFEVFLSQVMQALWNSNKERL